MVIGECNLLFVEGLAKIEKEDQATMEKCR